MSHDNPPDQAARDRIVADIETNLFVEAGAGAGKTTSLVGRIVALVGSGIQIDEIAAITFTEKAAAELRHRVKEDLSEAIALAIEEGSDAERVGRFDDALDRLDHAPIGTLHAFARRLLHEFPIAAGVPPGFTVLDQLQSDVAFQERWDDLLDDLLGQAEPADGPVAGGATFVELCSFEKFGIGTGLRRAAIDFHANWDLVAERVDLSTPPPWAPDVSGVLGAAEAVCAHEPPVDDKQTDWVMQARDQAQLLRTQRGLLSTLQAVDDLAEICRRACKAGNKTNWRKHRTEDELHELRGCHADVHQRATAVLCEAREYRKRVVGVALGRWVLESAEARAREGQLEFHDLLVLARRLLATSDIARRALHDRYRRVLLDEFQDTDPIQLAIALLLTADPDGSSMRPLPGRLFIVGDPKQSIYRFRRADIAQYLRAADQIGAETEYLTANFRSSTAVIDWVNEVFGEAIQPVVDAQPDFHALTVNRLGSRDHGSVSIVGGGAHSDLEFRGGAEPLREREADDIADAVVTALADGWPVGDKNPSDEPILRRCRAGDITILLPARTSLPVLEQALRLRNVPYRAENSSVVYVTNEIRHLMLALRAADDASDALALVAALRTPLYGCSDPELYEWASAGGRWSIWAPAPDGFGHHRVAAGIAHLRSIAERSLTAGPADLLASLVDERRLLDAALDDVDARDVWRRARYVIEQARAWSDAGGRGLRRYRQWVHQQATDARAADAILPEHDHDAVRVMTVHAAKGLEFPITMVSGLTTRPLNRGGYAVVWPNNTWALARKDDDIFEDFKPIDEQMSDAERRRLLYVACTRAVDHLVVSLHRIERKVSDQTKMSSAELLHDVGGGSAATAADFTSVAGRVADPDPSPVHLEWADPDVWSEERDRAFHHAGRVDAISATALAAGDHEPDPGLDKEPVDLDLPPWQRGRYGTAVGRAVHAVLQFADLSTGDDINDQAAAQCAAEGILGMDDTVATLARSALSAPIVHQAISGDHHRELFVAADVGSQVLEGYIDLFIRTADGGVIVDYKTDQWPDDRERAERLVKYRRQLAAYAVALEIITGESVGRGVLVRCRPEGPAEQIELEGWGAAIDEVRQSLRSRA